MILSACMIAGLLIVSSSLRASVPTSDSSSVAPSDIAHDCSADVTGAILSWIATVPDGSTLLFARDGCYRIEGTLEIRGRSGLTVDGNGSTFRSYDPPDDQRSIWRVIDSSGFVFRNMTIRGSYANGGVHDPSMQHAHAIDVRGTSVEVANVTASDMAGDCVYLGLGYSTQTRSSGSVHDVNCSRVGRNAVSVTAGDDVRIERVTTDRIGFIAFDIEPNSVAGFGSRRVTVADNTIGSYYLYAWAIVGDGPVSDQVFANNQVVGNRLALAVISPSDQQRSNVTITGNVSDTAQWSPAMEIQRVNGLTVTGNTVPMSGGTMATVDNSCTIDVSNNSYPGGSSEVLVANTPSNCPTPPAAPSIGSFSPTSGAAGTSVSVSGSGFTGASAVRFNGVSAAYTVVSSSQIQATVPSGAGSGPLSVTTSGGTATSSAAFSVTSAAPAAPSIGSFAPMFASVGATVVITGSGFTGATGVEFDEAVPALFTVDSDSQITAIVPLAASSGRLIVRTPAGMDKSTKLFHLR